MKISKTLIPFLTFALSSLFAEWSQPVTIFSAQSALNPTVGVDGFGNAVIISTVSDDGLTFYTKAAQLVRGSVKNVQPFISSGVSQGIHAISVNTYGNAAAVWLEHDPKEFDYLLRTSILINNQWSKSTTISENPHFNVEHFITPGIHIDSTSNALMVWPSQDNYELTFHVPAHRLSPIASHKHQDIFRTSDFLTSVALSGSPSGKTLAIWCTEDPFVLQAAYYNGIKWDISKVSSDVFSTGIPLACVSMNSTANALLLWNNNSTRGLSSISFENGKYGKEQTFYSPHPNEMITSIKLALDDLGNGMALWTTFNSAMNTYHILANRYHNGAWNKSFILDNSKFKLRRPNIALDDQGNALAVWEKEDSSKKSSIQCKQYKNGSWLDTTLQLSPPNVSATSPKIAMNTYGSTTVVWNLQERQTQTIQAVFTKNRSPLPPRNFQVKQVKNDFLMQIDYVNILTWSPSPDPQVTSYCIYRNGTFLASIQADSLLVYEDHYRNKKEKSVYFLTSVNNNGDQSSPLTLTII